MPAHFRFFGKRDTRGECRCSKRIEEIRKEISSREDDLNSNKKRLIFLGRMGTRAKFLAGRKASPGLTKCHQGTSARPCRHLSNVIPARSELSQKATRIHQFSKLWVRVFARCFHFERKTYGCEFLLFYAAKTHTHSSKAMGTSFGLTFSPAETHTHSSGSLLRAAIILKAFSVTFSGYLGVGIRACRVLVPAW